MPTPFFLFFFFNDTATTEIYTLSLHDALPIFEHRRGDEAQCEPLHHAHRIGDGGAAMKPAFHESLPDLPIELERVRLRRIEESDADAVFAIHRRGGGALSKPARDDRAHPGRGADRAGSRRV